MFRIFQIGLPGFLLVFFFAQASPLMATHNRAGEITFEQIGPLTLKVTITTYTKSSSVAADRDSLLIEWGDGSSQVVPRSNGRGQELGNDIKLNLYIAEHTYPGRSTYTLRMTDPNRNGGILNLNPPSSDAIQFFLETQFTFLNQQFQGSNSSPVLLQPPIDFGILGQPFVHNPNAYDPDGDSLAYELIVPQQGPGEVVPNYFFPNQIAPGANNNISLNSRTGEFRWDSPQRAGEYSIAMRIYEFRNGQLISSMIRDMQILILDRDNRPPTVEGIENHCIIAGNTLNVSLFVNDPDQGQRVRIQPFGGPFVQNFSPAEIIGPVGFTEVPFDALFQWNTLCDHISGQNYTAIIRAEDNFLNGQSGLSTLKVLNIKVLGDSPKDVTAEASEDLIEVSWEDPYSCEFTETDYFRGFDVWRKINSNPFVPDFCETGMQNRGYTKVGSLLRSSVAGRYVFVDRDVERGKTYCYRIVAVFGRLTPAGFPYNLVEGKPSLEVCEQLVRDVPFPLNVDVRETDQEEGSIYIRWTLPDPLDLDTLQNPGPYTYELERSTGLGTEDFTPLEGTRNSYPFFQSIVDTVFLDESLNTVENPYTYRIAFYTEGNMDQPYGYSPTASSVRLNLVASDRRITLQWLAAVPWENYDYAIFRWNEDEMRFDSIGKTQQLFYNDTGLTNEKNYCYKIKTFGQYGIEGLPYPLINFSQEICGFPIDTVPPCPPVLTVSNECSNSQLAGEVFTNLLQWRLGQGDCINEDLAFFRVYYAQNRQGPFALLEQLEATSRDYIHRPDLGFKSCYALTAVDSLGNETPLGEIVCAEECPDYILPNTFTPNGDGSNDLFRPILNRFIKRVEFKVYNRWGNLVFETRDPALNWNGLDSKGRALDAATYFYTCVFYRVGEEDAGTSLSGYIELIK
jgi:gliding motility-associated-like protein